MRRIKTYNELMHRVLEVIPNAREFAIGDRDEVTFLLFRAPDQATLARLRSVLSNARVTSTDNGAAWLVLTGYAAPRGEPLRPLMETTNGN